MPSRPEGKGGFSRLLARGSPPPSALAVPCDPRTPTRRPNHERHHPYFSERRGGLGTGLATRAVGVEDAGDAVAGDVLEGRVDAELVGAGCPRLVRQERPPAVLLVERHRARDSP